MIVTISGLAGSGKNKLGDFLSEEFEKHTGHKHERFSAGDFRRALADKHGMSIIELNKIGETESWTDLEADMMQMEYAKKYEHMVVDGRLSFYFMKKAIDQFGLDRQLLNIYIDVSDEEAANRIWKDISIKGANRNEGEFGSKEEVLKSIRERKQSDIVRYGTHYRGLNPYQKHHYHFYLDSSDLKEAAVKDAVLEYVKTHF